jgi:arylsulfatase A-like enzyme
MVFDNVDRKYYSEPGGDVFDGNGGRAGLKRSNLQGGIVVPLIIRWPDQIAPGSTSKRMVANYDILPTIAELTGFEPSFQCDGLSFYSELLNSSSSPDHEYLVYASFLGPTLITFDGWKIRTVLKNNRFELYNLNNDYREEYDLAAEHPEKLQELKDLLLEACEGDLSNGLYSWGRSQIPLDE